MNHTETAYAKINIALHVRRKRSDGYHDIETVFAFCADGDIVTAKPAEELTLTIDGPFAAGLATTDNLVLDAARAIGVTAALHLTKNLPVASGIGGGSADAAAVLRLFPRHPGESRGPLSRTGNGTGGEMDPGVRRDDDFTKIAAKLGADVPACVVSRTMRGSGKGDDLTRLPSLAGTPVLLVNPRVPLSTAAVFSSWDGKDRGPLGDWHDGRNDLETPARRLVPQIGEVLEWLAAQPGAALVRMSGSGATCFALFGTMTSRDAAAARVPADWWHLASVLR
ncbi:4-diphosphocytidyl-2-C-methyl-D-erythritol kinase [Sphingomonas antarctica]|uniref:4-(cytidine 5'-diphospho)-2-C-methyl-D-erythritol kinase n=1 Tax=Sphingomonas antarctica TaxID=2040274 RepID=UPI0039EAABCC